MKLLRREQCPKCAKEGRDNSRDNLAVYDDGHSFCYSCHTIYSTKKIFKPVEEKKHEVFLPSDCSVDYPVKALQWINKYDLTKNDLYSNGVLWSEYYQRLIFPVFGETLLAWQGRYFGQEKAAKWFGRGNLKNTFHFIGKGDKLILVEDIVSAIKLSSIYMAMPIFGSFIGRERFKRLYKLFGKDVEVLIWLDPDKRKEALKESKLGALCGLHTKVIFSDKDPKEHSYDEIKEIVK